MIGSKFRPDILLLMVLVGIAGGCDTIEVAKDIARAISHLRAAYPADRIAINVDGGRKMLRVELTNYKFGKVDARTLTDTGRSVARISAAQFAARQTLDSVHVIFLRSEKWGFVVQQECAFGLNELRE